MAWWPEGQDGEAHYIAVIVVSILALVFFILGQIFTTRVSIDILEHCNPEGLKESAKNVWTNVGVTSALILTMVMAMLQMDDIEPRGFVLEPSDKIQLQQFYGAFCIASLLFNLLCIMSCVVHLSYVDPLSDVDAIKFFLMRIDSLGDPIVYMVESCIFFMAAIGIWVLGTLGLALAIMNVVALIIFVAGNGALWAKISLFTPKKDMKWTQDPSLWAAEDITYGLKKRCNNDQVVSFVKKFGQVVLAEGREPEETMMKAVA
ncbi:Uncharacterized protein SCF082_LOCUS42302 [Durusdinium trenchii]|uniref:Uncharacterized protein n=1 Tax=Durusdinium trenchii TaxID=1381693 RepID=A0ABP0QN26_9DINO